MRRFVPPTSFRVLVSLLNRLIQFLSLAWPTSWRACKPLFLTQLRQNLHGTNDQGTITMDLEIARSLSKWTHRLRTGNQGTSWATGLLFDKAGNGKCLWREIFELKTTRGNVWNKECEAWWKDISLYLTWKWAVMLRREKCTEKQEKQEKYPRNLCNGKLTATNAQLSAGSRRLAHSRSVNRSANLRVSNLPTHMLNLFFN